MSTQITEWNNGGLVVSGLLDFVNAELDDSDGNDNLPRLPPLRLGVNATATWGAFSLSTRLTHVTDQDKEAEFELPTNSYNDWSVTASYTVPLDAANLNLFVRGKNLTADEQRDHTSFIKDFAPRPGRSVEAGLRLTF